MKILISLNILFKKLLILDKDCFVQNVDVILNKKKKVYIVYIVINIYQNKKDYKQFKQKNINIKTLNK